MRAVPGTLVGGSGIAASRGGGGGARGPSCALPSTAHQQQGLVRAMQQGRCCSRWMLIKRSVPSMIHGSAVVVFAEIQGLYALNAFWFFGRQDLSLTSTFHFFVAKELYARTSFFFCIR